MSRYAEAKARRPVVVPKRTRTAASGKGKAGKAKAGSGDGGGGGDDDDDAKLLVYCPKGHEMTRYQHCPPHYSNLNAFPCDFCARKNNSFALGMWHCDQCRDQDCCADCALGQQKTMGDSDAFIAGLLEPREARIKLDHDQRTEQDEKLKADALLWYRSGIAMQCMRGHRMTQHSAKPADYGGNPTSYPCDFCGRKLVPFSLPFFHCSTCGNVDQCPSCTWAIVRSGRAAAIEQLAKERAARIREQTEERAAADAVQAKAAAALGVPFYPIRCPKNHFMAPYDCGAFPPNYEKAVSIGCDLCSRDQLSPSFRWFHCDDCRNYDCCAVCADLILRDGQAAAAPKIAAEREARLMGREKKAAVDVGELQVAAQWLQQHSGPVKVRCPEGHLMQRYSSRPDDYNIPNYSCDYCARKKIPFSLPFYHCDDCGSIDACSSCSAVTAQNMRAVATAIIGAHKQQRLAADDKLQSAAADELAAAVAGHADVYPLLRCGRNHVLAKVTNVQQIPAYQGLASFSCDWCGATGKRFDQEPTWYHCKQCANYDVCCNCALAVALNPSLLHLVWQRHAQRPSLEQRLNALIGRAKRRAIQRAAATYADEPANAVLTCEAGHRCAVYGGYVPGQGVPRPRGYENHGVFDCNLCFREAVSFREPMFHCDSCGEWDCCACCAEQILKRHKTAAELLAFREGAPMQALLKEWGAAQQTDLNALSEAMALVCPDGHLTFTLDKPSSDELAAAVAALAAAAATTPTAAASPASASASGSAAAATTDAKAAKPPTSSAVTIGSTAAKAAAAAGDAKASGLDAVAASVVAAKAAALKATFTCSVCRRSGLSSVVSHQRCTFCPDGWTACITCTQQRLNDAVSAVTTRLDAEWDARYNHHRPALDAFEAKAKAAAAAAKPADAKGDAKAPGSASASASPSKPQTPAAASAPASAPTPTAVASVAVVKPPVVSLDGALAEPTSRWSAATVELWLSRAAATLPAAAALLAHIKRSPANAISGPVFLSLDDACFEEVGVRDAAQRAAAIAEIQRLA